MALSTSTMRASLGNVAAFAPLRPAVRRARLAASVRAEKSLGDKIQEKTDVRMGCTPNTLCVYCDCHWSRQHAGKTLAILHCCA